MKAEYQLGSSKSVSFILKPTVDWVAEETNTLRLLIGAKGIDVNADYQPEQGVPAAVTAVGELYMPLDGLIDVGEETKRLEKEITKVAKELEKADQKLGNPSFMERAKPEIVEEHRQRRGEWQKRLEQLKEMLSNLKG